MRRIALTVLLASATSLALASGASALEWQTQYGVGIESASSGAFESATINGISVAADGTVVASDPSGNRVLLFAPSGKFLRGFGKNVSLAPGEGPEVCTTNCYYGSTGSEAGALSSPNGVVAGAGEIYVVEGSGYRVSVFNYQGQFLRAFGANVGGAGVNICTSTCTYGTSGNLSGQLNGPTAAALDAAGELLVTETGNARVSAFNPQSGQFIRAFGKNVGGPGVDICTTTCTNGEYSNSPGALESPYGISVAPNGDVYVAEEGNSRISVFNSSGQFLRSFGSFGSGSGNLDDPYGVAVAPNGTVYVADTYNYRLSVFGADGVFQSAMGWNVSGPNTGAGTCTAPCQMGSSEYGVGSIYQAFAVTTDCRGSVYVSGYYRIDKYSEPGARNAPCPSNAFSIGKATPNKKKGTLSVEVDVPGPGSLSATAGPKIASTSPQPAGAGALQLTLKASGKGVKALAKTGRLKGSLSVTFTPPNGDPNTQSTSVQLAKTVKKHKKAGKHKGGKHHH